MAVNTVPVTLQIRNSIAENWVTRNPVLAQGEYGLESDTFLLKVGDGIRDWQHLPYLNKFDAEYFAKTVNGDIKISNIRPKIFIFIPPINYLNKC